jgi:hypothetical protein
MKYLIMLFLVVTACQESECDKNLRAVTTLQAQYDEMKALPEWNAQADMKKARIAVQLSMAKIKYNRCINGE